jgi:hypothetical protein
MRLPLIGSLAMSVLGLLLPAAAVLAALHLGQSRDSAHGSLRMVDWSLDLTALQHGVMSWDSVYEAQADRLTVWHTFPRLANFELEEGARSSEVCLKLYQIERFHALVSTTVVKLCTVRNGTRIFLVQHMYLRP